MICTHRIRCIARDKKAMVADPFRISANLHPGCAERVIVVALDFYLVSSRQKKTDFMRVIAQL